MTSAPLTLGTAGHVDHGKTALVAALTGIDTDRLPEERARGLTIELGYAPLELPSGRRLSVIDVPGHERFVRTMVAGTTGIDLFLMVVAADDGVMPQTREHAAILAGLGVASGVVAITKTDLADPTATLAEASDQFPGIEAVPCSARTAAGVPDVVAALDRAASVLAPRDRFEGSVVMHVDRVFTIHGAGTVVTGTLWSGAVAPGDTLVLLPARRDVRVRGVQVHGHETQRAEAGQRVAVNLAGVSTRDIGRGDALISANAPVQPTTIVDAVLDLNGARHGARVQVHHGTRDTAGRLVALDGRYWQLRLEQPLLAADSDRIVIRSIAPPDTLGGGTILDARARRHGRRPEIVDRLSRIERGETEPALQLAVEPKLIPTRAPERLPAAALALAECLRAARYEPPTTRELGAAAEHLPALRQAGLAVRIGRDMHAHPDALRSVRERVTTITQSEGAITLARLRDELGTSRKYAQALLEHLDATRVTRRMPDDRRVLRRTQPPEPKGTSDGD